MFNIGNPKANVIIDLETLGTHPTSVILAIGACNLDKSQMFKCCIDWKHWNPKCTVDKSTQDWWDTQNPKLKEQVFGGKVTPDSVLNQFTVFLNHVQDLAGEDIKVWGNGASFDLSILAHAYSSLEEAIPWKFRNERCFRTIKNLFPLQVPFIPNPKLIAHDPLDDAINEVDWLNQIIEEYK